MQNLFNRNVNIPDSVPSKQTSKKFHFQALVFHASRSFLSGVVYGLNGLFKRL